MSCIKKNQHRIIWITINLVLSKSYNQGRIFKGAKGPRAPWPKEKKGKKKKKGPPSPKGKKKRIFIFYFFITRIVPHSSKNLNSLSFN